MFKHDQEKKEQEIILTDESEHKDRYNLFTLIEGTDITFRHKGQYSYYVYDANDVECENGKMKVITAAEAIEYAYPAPNENNFVYS